MSGAEQHAVARFAAGAVVAFLAAGCSSSGHVAAPSIASLTPASGPVGTVVTLQGTGLAGTVTVSFGSRRAPFEQISPTQVLARVPRGASTSHIRLVTDHGSTATDLEFTVAGKPLPDSGGSSVFGPSITSVYPTTVFPGELVEIRGRGFTGLGRVTVGGVAATFVVAADDDVRVVVPRATRAGPVVLQTGRRGPVASAPLTVRSAR